jgi:hypothetical protein
VGGQQVAGADTYACRDDDLYPGGLVLASIELWEGLGFRGKALCCRMDSRWVEMRSQAEVPVRFATQGFPSRCDTCWMRN